jgi:zinc-binding alcohol dehydrogenase/oxidoreductase
LQALVLTEPNTYPTLTEVAQPVVAKGQTLLKLHAAALNHRDLWICKGQYAAIQLPTILGSDGVGETESGQRVLVNPGVAWPSASAVQPASFRVLGMPDQGTFAEFIAVSKADLVAAPAHLSDDAAAALPLAGLTAWRALVSRAQCKRGEKVLITGIGGGVAVIALQLATALGAEVWVTSSSDDKIARAVTMGAQNGVNYKQTDWFKSPELPKSGFDVIIDGAGGGDFDKLARLAAPGGRIAIYGGTAGAFPSLSPQAIFWKQLSILGTTMGHRDEFKKMVAFVAKHEIAPVVDRFFAMDSGSKAFEYLATGSQFGKIVISILDLGHFEASL